MYKRLNRAGKRKSSKIRSKEIEYAIGETLTLAYQFLFQFQKGKQR